MANKKWQTDSRLQMTSPKSGGHKKLKITINADNDDTARSPKMIVTLPSHNQFKGVRINNRKHDTTPYQIMGNGNLVLPHDPPKTDAYVQFDIWNMNKEDFVKEISLLPVNGDWEDKASAGAFVYSLSPELNKENNYHWTNLN